MDSDARLQAERRLDLPLHARKRAGAILNGSFRGRLRRRLGSQLWGLRARHGVPCETQIRFLQRGPDFDAAAKAIQSNIDTQYAKMGVPVPTP